MIQGVGGSKGSENLKSHKQLECNGVEIKTKQETRMRFVQCNRYPHSPPDHRFDIISHSSMTTR